MLRRWFRQTSPVVAIALVSLLSGCARPRGQLYPVHGDLFTLFPGPGAREARATRTGDPESRFECFSEEVKKLAGQADVAGGVMLSLDDGWTRSVFQVDHLNRGRQIAADTRVPIESITKMFTSAAVVRLARQGDVELHRPISAYLPELSRASGVGSVTLHQLMTHTSGLRAGRQCESEQTDLPDILETYSAEPLWSPPGAVFNYSNVGYSFVGLVLERTMGVPFEQVIKEQVLLSPVGIAGALFGPGRTSVRDHRPPNLATAEPLCRAMWPSGGLVMSLNDLSKWTNALAQPDTSPLGAPVVQLLTRPYVDDGLPASSAF